MNPNIPDLQNIMETEKKMFGKYLVPVAILLIIIGIFGILSPIILSGSSSFQVGSLRSSLPKIR
ncbi:hypothetical protein A6M27_06670 [Acidithiobacillus thiooxidans]|uniref:Uncharacterized protein n=1 Tax=Acidithiobacillus thiooxidans TaxID=930 RepID=A0A1C2JK79_ACITH|nr:hypothetical protein A6P07_18070 [Acidithiobacillus thiooxidans]OCX72306.1 hypothetical protein A6O24_14155 [Acidithiobacillus thiooxidans]OCX88603.1 hypothetical protein A6M27_06670 [Acidithiobacillus thiooxidans]OFC43607.1 hypothetical protein BAE47_12870 [Acidithiobacillus thiooxidans]